MIPYQVGEARGVFRTLSNGMADLFSLKSSIRNVNRVLDMPLDNILCLKEARRGVVLEATILTQMFMQFLGENCGGICY